MEKGGSSSRQVQVQVSYQKGTQSSCGCCPTSSSGAQVDKRGRPASVASHLHHDCERHHAHQVDGPQRNGTQLLPGRGRGQLPLLLHCSRCGWRRPAGRLQVEAGRGMQGWRCGDRLQQEHGMQNALLLLLLLSLSRQREHAAARSARAPWPSAAGQGIRIGSGPPRPPRGCR